MLAMVLEAMAKPFERKKIEVVCAVESRGFIFGSALASDLGAGFVPIRKPGKLPWKTSRQEYALEYGNDALEMHLDAVQPGQKTLLVDDLLATGGTASASLELLRKAQADVIGTAFVLELKALKGREKLTGVDIHSLIEV